MSSRYCKGSSRNRSTSDRSSDVLLFFLFVWSIFRHCFASNLKWSLHVFQLGSMEVSRIPLGIELNMIPLAFSISLDFSFREVMRVL